MKQTEIKMLTLFCCCLSLWFFFNLFTSSAFASANLQERYSRVSEEHHEALKEVEEEHPDLIEQWIELRDVREKWKDMAMVLGSGERRGAERKISNIERNWEREAPRFQQRLERVLRPYERRYDRLQNEIWNLQERMDPRREDDFYRKQEEVDELRKEAESSLEIIDALDALKHSLDFSVAEGYARLRMSEDAAGFIRSNAPRLIEGRWELLDRLADVKGLQQKKRAAGEDWSNYQEDQLESAIDSASRVRDNLESHVDRELRDELREKRDLQREIDRLENRLDGLSSERLRERLSCELEEKTDEMNALQEEINWYRRVLQIPGEFSSQRSLIE